MEPTAIRPLLSPRLPAASAATDAHDHSCATSFSARRALARGRAMRLAAALARPTAVSLRGGTARGTIACQDKEDASRAKTQALTLLKASAASALRPSPRSPIRG
jgi:hypothetical protein